jgi:hypothetical protein
VSDRSRTVATPGKPRSGSLLTAEEVAARYSVEKAWVYALSRAWVDSNGRRGIPTVTVGRYRRYRSERLDQWDRELERGEAQA